MRTDLDAEDAIDVFVAQRKKALAELARDPQLAAVLTARGIDLNKDDSVGDLSPDEIRALLQDDDKDDDRQMIRPDSDDEDDRLEELGVGLLDADALKKSRIIPPLPPVDHSTIAYEEFGRYFLEEHAEIAALTPDQIRDLRTKLGMNARGIATAACSHTLTSLSCTPKYALACP